MICMIVRKHVIVLYYNNNNNMIIIITIIVVITVNRIYVVYRMRVESYLLVTFNYFHCPLRLFKQIEFIHGVILFRLMF